MLQALVSLAPEALIGGDPFVNRAQCLAVQRVEPLPAIAPAWATWAKAKLHGNCHVQHEYCQYSAPFRLIHQTLWLEITPDALRIYQEHDLVAIHPRLFKPGTHSTAKAHVPPEPAAMLIEPTLMVWLSVVFRLAL